VFGYLSIPQADEFLRKENLLKENEPCGLIAHAFIHALDGDFKVANDVANNLIDRFGLTNTQSERWVRTYVGILSEACGRWLREKGGITNDQVARAFVGAQSIEALTSFENRRGTAPEVKLAWDTSLVLVLNFPTALIEHFIKWKDPHNDVPCGSAWARQVYGQIFRYEDRRVCIAKGS
jgi:hypothetical protein